MSDEEKQLNSLVLEVRVLEGTYNELATRQNFLERALVESRAALEALNALASSKPEEVVIPIGGGLLIRSPPPDPDKVLVNVGSNVVLERSRVEALAFLQERLKDIENSLASVISQRNQIAERIEADRRAMQVILSRQGKPS